MDRSKEERIWGTMLIIYGNKRPKTDYLKWQSAPKILAVYLLHFHPCALQVPLLHSLPSPLYCEKPPLASLIYKDIFLVFLLVVSLSHKFCWANQPEFFHFDVVCQCYGNHLKKRFQFSGLHEEISTILLHLLHANFAKIKNSTACLL